MLLLDLPNELILQILDLYAAPSEIAQQQDFLSLAECCRRLNALVTPALLREVYKLQDLSNFSIVAGKQPRSEDIDILSVLSVSFFVRSIDRLCCQFSGLTITDILYNCSRLQVLISRLDRLKELEIRFPAHYTGATNFVGDGLLRSWANIFGELLNTAVTKGCLRLHVKNGATLPESYVFWSQDLVNTPTIVYDFLSRKVFNRKCRVLRTRLAGYTRFGPIGSQIILSPPLSKPQATSTELSGQTPSSRLLPVKREQMPNLLLRSLHIASYHLVIPPFSSWLVDAIQTSPDLSSLSFSYIHRSNQEWAFILSLLSDIIPSSTALSSFSFTQCTAVPISKFDRFIRGLNPSNLTQLTIDYSMHYIAPLSSELPALPPVFPKLTIITAPADYYTYLLKSPTNLTRITKAGIYPRSGYFTQFGYEESALYLGPILRELFTRSSAVKCNTATMDTTIPDLMPTKPYISLLIVGKILELVQDDHTGPGGGVGELQEPGIGECCYDSVMELSLSSFVHYWNQANALATWIAKFKGLRNLIFRSHSSLILTPGNWDRTGPSFIDLLKEACPNLQVFRNGVDVYQLGTI